MARFICQLPQEVQAEIERDATEILHYIGKSETEIQIDLHGEFGIMQEKLINVIGYGTDYLGHPLELDFDKYKRYL